MGSSYHWTDNLLEDPYKAERRHKKEMARMFKEQELKDFICDAQYGIPTRCPCGGSMKHEVSPTPKYKNDFDTKPGMRYFTCEKYKDDGFHFRQPWVFGVEDEVKHLKRDVGEQKKMIEEQKQMIEEQKKMIEDMRKEIQNLTQEVSNIQQFI